MFRWYFLCMNKEMTIPFACELSKMEGNQLEGDGKANYTGILRILIPYKLRF
jgi:hypothetical protein